MRKQDLDQELAEIERRRLEGKLSHEEAIFARQNLIQENKVKAQRMKEEVRHYTCKCSYWFSAEESVPFILVLCSYDALFCFKGFKADAAVFGKTNARRSRDEVRFI